MSKRLPIIARPRSIRSYSLEQRDFSAGIWNDVVAVSVPIRGLWDGENIVIDELGHIRGRPGAHYLTEPLPGDPLALGYIPKAGDNNAYFVAKVGNKLYCCTHDPESPAYFLTWQEIKAKRGYCTGPSFGGSGLNDFHVRGKYDGDTGIFYIAKIDGTGSPNTFRWSKDGGSTWVATGVPITGSKQALESGIQVLFNSTTGHTLNDQWYFFAYSPFGAGLADGETSTFSNYGDKLILHDSIGLYEILFDQEKSRLVWIKINCGTVFSLSNVWPSNANGTGHYFRRYTYTCAVVKDGIVTHESEPWHFYSGMAGAPLDRWTFNTFRNSTPFGQTPISIGGLPDLAFVGNRHWTHLILYSTLNITYENDDQFFGIVTNGADDEVFIYNAMIEMENGDWDDTAIVDSANDSTLQTRLEAGHVLKSRYLDPIPNGRTGAIVRDFVFSYHAESGKIYYSSALSPHPKHFGYCHEDQWVRGQASTNAIAGAGTKAVFLGDRITSTINVSNYEFGGESISPVPILTIPVTASSSVGVPKGNVSTIAQMESESFVAVTNEGLRIFDGFKWSEDVSDKKFNRQVRDIPAGAIGVYGSGRYYLWYRSSASQSVYNDACLVTDLRQKHLPWTRIKGIATDSGGLSFPMPPQYCGAIAIEYQGKTLICCYRRHYGSIADRRIYWIDTFDSSANPIFSREIADQYHEAVFKTADVACSWTTRDWTGRTEQHKLTCRNLYLYWSVDPDFEEFPAGFEANLLFIQDGEEKEPLKKVKTQDTEVKEISPSWQNEGRRLGMRFSTNKTGFLFRGYTIDVDERKEPASGEGGNIHLWVTNQKNLSTGLQFAASSWKLIDLVPDGPGYSAGRTTERWTNGILEFQGYSGQGRFSRTTGPDGIANSAISVERLFGAAHIGFRMDSLQEFILSPTFTVSVWARTPANYLSDLLVFSPTPALWEYLRMQLRDTQLRIADNLGNYKTYNAGFTDWRHLAVVRDNSNWTIHVDGAPVSPASQSGTLVAPANCRVISLGSPALASMAFFEPRHYSKSLSTEDLVYHYNDVTKNKGRSTLPLR